jgi:SAM-dependent methyltransferase
MVKSFLEKPYLLFCSLLFDPLEIINKWRALPYFARNLWCYWRLNHGRSFRLCLREIFYSSYDRFDNAGMTQGHYFWQDLWAAHYLFNRKLERHVDVGSRLDGFIAHILPFCRVVYVDSRPLTTPIDGLEFLQGSILEMPFANDSVSSLSCLHVIEHIGLGRYGDPVDPDGYLKAARELVRVLTVGGILLLGTPVGRERLCFDAHRIFDPQTVVDAFAGLQLEEFSLIDDKGMGILQNASFAKARCCRYGCGLFIFRK